MHAYIPPIRLNGQDNIECTVIGKGYHINKFLIQQVNHNAVISFGTMLFTMD